MEGIPDEPQPIECLMWSQKPFYLVDSRLVLMQMAAKSSAAALPPRSAAPCAESPKCNMVKTEFIWEVFEERPDSLLFKDEVPSQNVTLCCWVTMILQTEFVGENHHPKSPAILEDDTSSSKIFWQAPLRGATEPMKRPKTLQASKKCSSGGWKNLPVVPKKMMYARRPLERRTARRNESSKMKLSGYRQHPDNSRATQTCVTVCL